MTTAVDDLTVAAERLLRAHLTGTPCDPVRDLIAPDDVAAAYAVQQAGIAGRISAGAHVVGRKVGLTAPAVQAQLGVDRPDFGVLLDDMRIAHTGTVQDGILLQPKIEAEIAFTLAEDLDEPDLDHDRVRSAVATVHAALEIVDSRIADWDITFADTVADNASSGLFVLGPASVPVNQIEPRLVQMTLHRGSELVSEGTGANCLGDPLEALAWLARTAREHGEPLRAGQVVLSGALGPMVSVTPDDTFTATISGLGHVAVSFAPATTDEGASA